MPDTSIDDHEFRHNATQKAIALGLDSFVLWNVSHAHLYVRQGDTKTYICTKQWDTLAHIRSRDSIVSNRQQWEALATEIISYVNDLFDRGSLEGRQFVEAYKSGGVTSLIMENTDDVAGALQVSARRDANLKAEITLWWERYKSEYGGGDDTYKKLAQANISNWIGKFLFAHILQEKDNRAQAVSQIGDTTTPTEALAIFERLFPQDAFFLKPDTELQFRHPRTGQLFTERTGQFNAITSNLPFVAQEGRTQYGNAIAQVSSSFDRDAGSLPGNADVAAYLPFALHPLLAEGGKLGIIITNAWLSTAWGEAFFDLLGRYYHLKSVITSGAGRWFQNSTVVTNILLMEKKAATDEEDASIDFVVLTRPLGEISDPAATALAASQIRLGTPLDDTMTILDKKVKPVAYSATAYQAYMKDRTQSHEQYAAGDIGWDELGARSAERMEGYFKKGKGGSYFSFASCGNEVLAREVMPNYQYKPVLMEYMSNMSAFARKADKENMQPEDFAIGAQRIWTDFASKEQQVMSQYQAQNAAAWRQVGQTLMQSSAQSSNSFESSGPSCMFNPATNANQQCLHVTAGGQCAHYGAPCR